MSAPRPVPLRPPRRAVPRRRRLGLGLSRPPPRRRRRRLRRWFTQRQPPGRNGLEQRLERDRFLLDGREVAVDRRVGNPRADRPTRPRGSCPGSSRSGCWACGPGPISARSSTLTSSPRPARASSGRARRRDDRGAARRRSERDAARRARRRRWRTPSDRGPARWPRGDPARPAATGPASERPPRRDRASGEACDRGLPRRRRPVAGGRCDLGRLAGRQPTAPEHRACTRPATPLIGTWRPVGSSSRPRVPSRMQSEQSSQRPEPLPHG